MKVAVLFSGGKDSCYALHLARKAGHEIVCLLTVISENQESFMFHTPTIKRTKEQAKAMGIPLLTITTKGEKERELKELAALIKRTKQDHAIEGVVTGAIESVYQASRIQRICAKLGLWVFNPLWKREQLGYLKELVQEGFEVVITGVAAEPLDESWLGRKIDGQCIQELAELALTHRIQPSGEGGEFESFVLSAPGWKSGLTIRQAHKEFSKGSGRLVITALEEKR